MSSIQRNMPALRSLSASMRPLRGVYGHRYYSAEAKPSTEDPSSNSQPSSRSTAQPPGEERDEDISTTPSNKARPTITDGRQSPNVDSQGRVRPDVPEDVKKHNEEMTRRHDRPYNQIKDEGKVHKGFSKRQ